MRSEATNYILKEELAKAAESAHSWKEASEETGKLHLEALSNLERLEKDLSTTQAQVETFSREAPYLRSVRDKLTAEVEDLEKRNVELREMNDDVQEELQRYKDVTAKLSKLENPDPIEEVDPNFDPGMSLLIYNMKKDCKISTRLRSLIEKHRCEYLGDIVCLHFQRDQIKGLGVATLKEIDKLAEIYNIELPIYSTTYKAWKDKREKAKKENSDD